MSQLKFQINRDLYPFVSRFMTMDNGAEVHYLNEGEGELTFLLLHGNPTWSFVYRKLVEGLASDYPGFGLSTAPDGYDFKAYSQYGIVEEFVQRLELENLILVVQDWGGPIGFALADQFPEKIKGMVVGNTWSWPMQDDRRFKTFSGIMGGPFGRSIARGFNGVWRFFMMRGFLESRTSEEMEMYAAPFASGENWRQTAVFPRELIQAVALEEKAARGLANLRDRPTLFLWGTQDFGFQEKERIRFENTVPNHETILLEASHFWQDEQGETAVCEIRKWLPVAIQTRSIE